MNAQRILPLAVCLLLGISAAPAIHAAPSKTPTLNGKFCREQGGTWDPGKAPVCTISSSLTVTSSFVIPTKVTLLLTSDAALDIQSGNVSNDGTILSSGAAITIEASGYVSNTGTFANSGTLSIENSYSDNTGFRNYGTFTNSAGGTMTIANGGSGGAGFFNDNGGTFGNAGTLTISNAASLSVGFFNSTGASFVNAGSVVIQAGFASDFGFYNEGNLVANNIGGSITVNSGAIGNYSSYVFANNTGATITINSEGTFRNNGPVTNAGTIVIGGTWNNLAYGTCTNVGTGAGCP